MNETIIIPLFALGFVIVYWYVPKWILKKLGIETANRETPSQAEQN